MAKILDFGTDGEGISGADWLQSCNEPDMPEGCNLIKVWVKPGVPIPVPDETYDMIHCKDSLNCNDVATGWRWIFSEFKRILKVGGLIVIQDCMSVEDGDEDFSLVEKEADLIKKVFEESFPWQKGWCCIARVTPQYGGEVATTAYVRKEYVL